MSESKESTDGKSTVEPTVQSEDVKDPKAVLAKNQELLGKVKSASEKAKALEDELNKIKSEKLAAEGKKDELIEALKSQVTEVKKRETQLGWNIVSGQVAVEAAKRGCVNVDTLMKVVDFGSAQIDTENFTVAKEDINLILDKAVKDHQYLFQSSVKKTKDAGASHSIDTEVDIGKMSKDKLFEAYRQVSMKKQ
jgi:hypothetical protein